VESEVCAVDSLGKSLDTSGSREPTLAHNSVKHLGVYSPLAGWPTVAHCATTFEGAQTRCAGVRHARGSTGQRRVHKQFWASL